AAAMIATNTRRTRFFHPPLAATGSVAAFSGGVAMSLNLVTRETDQRYDRARSGKICLRDNSAVQESGLEDYSGRPPCARWGFSGRYHSFGGAFDRFRPWIRSMSCAASDESPISARTLPA